MTIGIPKFCPMTGSNKNILDYLMSSNGSQESSTAKKQKVAAASGENRDNEMIFTPASTNVFYESSPGEKTQFDIQQVERVQSKILSEYLGVRQMDLAQSDISDFSSDRPVEAVRYSFMMDIRDANMRRRGEEGYDPTTLHIPRHCYDKFTAFEKQFWDIKSKHFDTVIFFKKGKFYELYEEDAEIASRLFDLRVAERVNMKMAGVPESNYEKWAAKFVAHGYRVGRVDQVENSIGKKIREQGVKADKIIARELKEIITTGTVYGPEFIESCMPFYVGVLAQHDKCRAEECGGPMHFTVMLYDASTNRILVTSFCDTLDCGRLRTIFVQCEIKELITDEKIQLGRETKRHRVDRTPVAARRTHEFDMEEEYMCFTYLYNFMKSLCREKPVESAVIARLEGGPEHMVLDGGTLVNLDILQNNFDGTEKNTLFGAIDYCNTPFGRRLLRRWIAMPLRCQKKITERRMIVSMLQSSDIAELCNQMGAIGDIERYSGKIGNNNPTFRDLQCFVRSLRRAAGVLETLRTVLPDSEFCARQHEETQKVLEDFERSYAVSESEILPGNENDELFVLERRQEEVKKQLDAFISELKGSTGYTDLCYKSVGKEVFQVETASCHRMPEGFRMVSSTKTHKRYYNDRLRDIISDYERCEELVFQSKGNIQRRAADFFRPHALRINQTVGYLATVDCLLSFAVFNRTHQTAEPVFGPGLEVIEFTNPVYPTYIRNSFVPGNAVTLLTGPNMGGKSTFLRSICLNIILAQMGMNVLCKSMKLPVFDRIFTRIGASDSLARGESTFMVEMREVSRILNECTEKSFVIMDELGRGTSTRDGEAVAHAVLDYVKRMGCVCLFSTHYHGLVHESEGVDKAFVECQIDSEDIVFLYRVAEGVCSDSHGLYVARTAGIPETVVTKAFEIKNAILEQKK